MSGLCVVAGMSAIIGERTWVGHLIWHRVDRRVDAERGQKLHQLIVYVRDCARPKSKHPVIATACPAKQSVCDDFELPFPQLDRQSTLLTSTHYCDSLLPSSS